MDHAIDHSASPDQPEGTSLTHLEKPAHPRGAFKPLFFIVLALAAALATACGMLYLQQQAAAVRAGSWTTGPLSWPRRRRT